MKARVCLSVCAAMFATLNLQPRLFAQPLVNIETVTVGDPGNAGKDAVGGWGSVAYEFNIGKYEITIGQYATFLNSVASVTSNNYLISLWHPGMATNLSVAGVARNGSGTSTDPYIYSVIGSSNRPIAYISWFDAARFANWLHNGATNGASTETGSYTLNGATNNFITKNSGAIWWIPTTNEWTKAAYYKSGGTNAGFWNYATRSDTPPGNTIGGASNQANGRLDYYYSVTQSSNYSESQNYLTEVGAFSNSASAYGTYDQDGNLWEWTDADLLGASWSWSTYWLSGVAVVGLRKMDYKVEDGGFRLARLTVLPPTPDPTPPLDGSPPTLRVTAPSTASVSTRAQRLVLRGTASDNVSPTSMQFRIKPPGGRYGNWSALNLAVGSATTKAWSRVVALSRRGASAVQIRAFDSAGNASATRTIFINRF